MKYLNDYKDIQAEVFVQGKKYDVLIFQKVYWKEMAKSFEGLKILDICDPDWLEGIGIMSTIENVDMITCSTEELAKDLRRLVKKPVIVIPDRIDLEVLPPPKVHKGEATKAVWFGYSSNMEVLDQAVPFLKKEGYSLTVISDGNYQSMDCEIENIKWDKDTVHEEIQKCDVALLPRIRKGRYVYKSNNKAMLAWALGVPVAENLNELKQYKSEEARIDTTLHELFKVKKLYDVSLSAKQLYEIICTN